MTVTVLEHTPGRVHATLPRQSRNPDPFHIDMIDGDWFCTCWKNTPTVPCRHVTIVQRHLKETHEPAQT